MGYCGAMLGSLGLGRSFGLNKVQRSILMDWLLGNECILTWHRKLFVVLFPIFQILTTSRDCLSEALDQRIVSQRELIPYMGYVECLVKSNVDLGRSHEPVSVQITSPDYNR